MFGAVVLSALSTSHGAHLVSKRMVSFCVRTQPFGHPHLSCWSHPLAYTALTGTMVLLRASMNQTCPSLAILHASAHHQQLPEPDSRIAMMAHFFANADVSFWLIRGRLACYLAKRPILSFMLGLDFLSLLEEDVCR